MSAALVRTLAILTFIGLAHQSLAQKKSFELTKNDGETIESLITRLVGDHFGLLGTVSDPTITPEQVEGAKDKRMNSIYLNGDTPIEPDYDASVTKTGLAEAKRIGDYLSELRNYVRSQGGPVEYKIDPWNKEVYRGEENPWTRVRFGHRFPGKDKNGKKYGWVYQVAEIQCTKAGGVWSTRISAIYFYDKQLNTNLERLKVSEEKGEDDIAAGNSSEYYREILDQGRISLRKKNYGEAWYCFKKAEEDKSQALQVQQMKDVLINEAKALSGEGTWEQYIFQQLRTEARRSEGKAHYKIAADYYQLAFDLNKEVKECKDKADEMWARQAKIDRLNRLLDNGFIDEALSGYRSAIDKDSCGSIFLGIARCYASKATGDSTYYFDDLAEKVFAKAVRLDPENAEIHKACAEYFKQKRQYEKAIQSYISLIASCGPAYPELSLALSLKASCWGLKIGLGKAEAIDSFRQAINYYAKNTEAYICLSNCYPRNTKEDFDLALDYAEKATKSDTNSSEAWLCLGNLMLDKSNRLDMEAKEDDIEKGRLYITRAIEKDKRNVEAYSARGNLILSQSSWTNEDLRTALSDFENAIRYSVPGYNKELDARWKKGKVYYYLDDYDKAYEQYKLLEKVDYCGISPGFCQDFGFLYLKKKEFTLAKQYFARIARKSYECIYGDILAEAAKDPSTIDRRKDELKEAIERTKGLNAARVSNDFKSLGLGNMLEQNTMRSILKKIK